MCSHDIEQILAVEPFTWLEGLHTWQADDVRAISASGRSESEILNVLLSVAGVAASSPFGGSGPSFYRRKFEEQVYLFLCSDKHYSVERAEWVRQTGVGKTSSVAFLSESISQTLGAAPPFLAPAVAVTLMTVGSIGLRAWCAAQAELQRWSEKGNASDESADE